VDWDASAIIAQLHGCKIATRSQKKIGQMPRRKPHHAAAGLRAGRQRRLRRVRDEKPAALLAAAKHSASTSPQIRKDVAEAAADTKTQDLLHEPRAGRRRGRRGLTHSPPPEIHMLTIEHCDNLHLHLAARTPPRHGS
jgi:hypothetical protein